MERTLRNDKTGETVTTSLTDREAADAFLARFGGRGHWLLFWLHKVANEAPRGSAGMDGAMQFVADSFLLAIGYGLKRPMIRLHYKDRRFKLYLSAKGTICLKTGRLAPGTHDPVGEEEYAGCLLHGRFLPAREGYGDRRGPERKPDATEQEFLDRLKADPVGFMAECSKDMGRCCYCNQPLEDPRSKLAGYGHTCARRWGLAWGKDKAEMEKAPSFARVYGREVGMLCQAVRRAPRDNHVWELLADWLEERSRLPRVKMPEDAAVILPRADEGAPVVDTPKASPPPSTGAVRVDSDKLVWDSADKTFTAEASTLGWWDMPELVEIRSVKTGGVKAFKKAGEDRDGSGEDLYGTRYASDDGLALLVIND